MAAVIGEFAPDLSRFHSMISSASSIPQHRDQRPHDASPYRSSSRHRLSPAAPRPQRPDTATQNSCSLNRLAQQGQRQTPAGQPGPHALSTGGASRFPSPPPSSSPIAASGPAAADDANIASMAAQMGGGTFTAGRAQPPTSDAAAAQRQQPSPPSDGFQTSNPGPSHGSYLVSTAATASQMPEQHVVHVRDLAHIVSLARADLSGQANGAGILHGPPLPQVKYEISGMPTADIIEMVAALLTKITTTNDRQHDAMQRNVAHQQQASQSADANGSPQMSPLSQSVLAFHGKNVPAITILSYLSRIHKYCPTTYEVFLSLLVYYDRMTERVNDMVVKSEQTKRQAASRPRAERPVAPQPDMPMGGAARGSDESGSDLVDDDESDEDDDMADSPTASSRRQGRRATALPSAAEPPPPVSSPATYFVVDSFNIHRLIISGVTCSSKFFSDVFYTNSRYAKVGGLPLPELNHLELQFLVLNDFRLAVPVEDLEAYATMLVEFYAREVVVLKSKGVE